MRACVVINPISGRASGSRDAGSRRASLVHDVATRVGVETDVAITERAGHAAEIARRLVAEGCDRIIVWGGDGTVNEAAGPILAGGARRTSASALGIIPGGSGDGLAHSLGLGHPPKRALEVAMTGPVIPIDAGYIGDRHFLNIAGVGFDAAVGTAFNRRGKRGLRGYVRQLFTTVWSYEPCRYRLAADGVVSEGIRFLIAFANGREYGNRMVLAPAADPSDGWLDVVTVDPGSPIRQLWRARRLAIGHGKPAEGIVWGRCRTATITGDRLLCHVDGETFQTTGTLDVRIVPGAIGICGARLTAGTSPQG